MGEGSFCRLCNVVGNGVFALNKGLSVQYRRMLKQASRFQHRILQRASEGFLMRKSLARGYLRRQSSSRVIQKYWRNFVIKKGTTVDRISSFQGLGLLDELQVRNRTSTIPCHDMNFCSTIFHRCFVSLFGWKMVKTVAHTLLPRQWVLVNYGLVAGRNPPP